MENFEEIYIPSIEEKKQEILSKITKHFIEPEIPTSILRENDLQSGRKDKERTKMKINSLLPSGVTPPTYEKEKIDHKKDDSPRTPEKINTDQLK